MAKQSEHQPKTTEYVDHDDKVQWDKDEKGKVTQEKKHVEKGTGGHVTEDKIVTSEGANSSAE